MFFSITLIGISLDFPFFNSDKNILPKFEVGIKSSNVRGGIARDTKHLLNSLAIILRVVNSLLSITN